MFTFKQFAIHQDNTAMKAGTDGVLLGAWCDFSGTERILDIGTGTGLIALMAAQKSGDESKITAIEIDEDAYKQACGNIANSKFAEKINVVNQDFVDFSQAEIAASKKYNYIVSNPPFFENSQKSNDSKRTLARHTDSLPFRKLIEGVSNVIACNGKFSVIIPAISCLDFVYMCALRGLHLCRKTLVITREGLSPIRVMLTFSNSTLPLIKDTIIIRCSNGEYTDEYKTITRDFYLRF